MKAQARPYMAVVANGFVRRVGVGLAGPEWCSTPVGKKRNERERESASEVTPATEMGQLRQNFVLQSEAENEIHAGFLFSFSNQKPGMKFTPALFGFPFS